LLVLARRAKRKSQGLNATKNGSGGGAHAADAGAADEAIVAGGVGEVVAAEEVIKIVEVVEAGGSASANTRKRELEEASDNGICKKQKVSKPV
jgi:hypothetical protein